MFPIFFLQKLPDDGLLYYKPKHGAMLEIKAACVLSIKGKCYNELLLVLIFHLLCLFCMQSNVKFWDCYIIMQVWFGA